MQGTSALFGTSECGLCRETRYWIIFSVFVFICIPFTIYIAYFSSAPTNVKSKYYDKRVSDHMTLFNILLFDIYFYFYQCLSIIFVSKGISVSSWFESIIMSMFNLQFLSVSASSDGDTDSVHGICIIPDMDAFDKLMLNFVYPISFLVPLAIIAVLEKTTDLTLLKCMCCCLRCKHRNVLAVKQYLDRNAFISKAFLRVLLLYIGTSISTLFQVMTVIELPNGNMVHFYAPNRSIYPSTIMVVALALLVILSVFALFLPVRRREMGGKPRSEIDITKRILRGRGNTT